MVNVFAGKIKGSSESRQWEKDPPERDEHIHTVERQVKLQREEGCQGLSCTVGVLRMKMNHLAGQKSFYAFNMTETLFVH